MAVTKQQVFAWVGAAVFLFTTLAFTGAVLLQMQQDNKREKEQTALQQAFEDAKSQASTDDSQQNVQGESTENQPNTGDNKLEGTQLADFTPGKTVTKLEAIDIKVGNGAVVSAGDTITAHYTGALIKNGVIFQSSHDTGSPFTSPLTSLIQGWQTGIPGMKEGGTRRLLIPAAEAYGATERPGIPANSDLIFDIELVKIEKSE